MHGRAVLFVLGNLLIILAVCLLAPLAVALRYGSLSNNGSAEAYAFLLTAAVAMAFGILARQTCRSAAGQVRVREGFAIVTFAWLAMCGIGMLPYLLTGATASVTDAFFETMSGFTTTGATIFVQVETLPWGLQFWRCMTQWLGGMGIVVLSVALLPILGVGGYRLLKAETPGGVAYERDRPRITDAAKDLWKLYLLFSAAQVLLLWISGTTLFDGFCHAFTTMSTGGFSPHTESVAYFQSPVTQWIIIVFMALAGMNFSVHAQFLRGRFRQAVQNSEVRLYFAILAGVSLLGLVWVRGSPSLTEKLRDVVFQVVSIGTTTGYATDDYDAWPQLMRFFMLALMLVGGCMGSTGGGMKVARVAVYMKSLLREVHRLIFPHGVRPMRIGQRVIEPPIVANILAFGVAFFAAFCLGSVVMAAYGYDLVTSFSASAAALGNIGPGLGEVGPTANWAHLPVGAKWVMSFLMLLGRLEIYSVLVLFTPWAWKR